MFCVSMQAYTQVNEMFADQTMHALRLLQKDKSANVTPLIWIHDYHLMLMANSVRQVCSDVIAFTEQNSLVVSVYITDSN